MMLGEPPLQVPYEPMYTVLAGRKIYEIGKIYEAQVVNSELRVNFQVIAITDLKEWIKSAKDFERYTPENEAIARRFNRFYRIAID